MNSQQPLMLDYQSHEFASSAIVHADCFEWMGRIATDSMHAIVTDPPYGVKEYDFDQIEKRANGNGGIWRIPPSFDGSKRAPLPRFTALNPQERKAVYRFFLNGVAFANESCYLAAIFLSPVMPFFRNWSFLHW